MKKIFAFMIMLAVLLSPLSTYAATAPEVGCEAAIAIDLDSGAVLFEKDADKKIFPASTTKILTAIIIIENRGLSENVTVGQEIRQGGITDKSSLMGLQKGDVLTVETLLYGMMLVSGNDAAATLAVSTAGSIEDFSAMMNEKAIDLGMSSSHFITPHGLHKDDHYTTARDMAILTRYAMKNETFRQIVSTSSYTIYKTDSSGKEKTETIRNTNMLIQPYDKAGNTNPYYYDGTTGIKTGLTPNAGGCIVASAEREGRSVAALIFGDNSDNNTARWRYAASMLDYAITGFSNYDVYSLTKDLTADLEVRHASLSDPGGGVLKCELRPTDNELITISKDEGDINNLRIVPTFNKGICAPLKQGNVVGEAEVFLGETKIYSGPLYASRNVVEEGFTSEDDDLSIIDGPVSIIDKVEVDKIDLTYDEKQNTKMLWWLAIPAAILIYLIIRFFTIKNSLYRKHIPQSSRR